jgi:hypothetical protein
MRETSKMMVILSLGLLAVTCGGSKASAPTEAAAPVSPFSGVWKLNIGKSSIPAEMAPVEMTTTIELEGDHIKISEESMQASADIQTVTVDAAFDGAAHPVSGSPTIDAAIYKLVDPRTLDVVAKKAGKVVMKEHFVVAEDGATMTDEITKKDGTAIGTAIYEK